jgi:predicted nucleic acid-binding protein
VASAYLLDTNTLLRLAKRDEPQYAVISMAVDRLIERGADLCYTPQNVVEFWNVFTRPREHNGFGLSVKEADRQALLIEKSVHSSSG